MWSSRRETSNSLVDPDKQSTHIGRKPGGFTPGNRDSTVIEAGTLVVRIETLIQMVMSSLYKRVVDGRSMTMVSLCAH